jgi:hypothetical protein
MTTATYNINDRVTLDGTFKANNVLTDPTNVFCVVQTPAGVPTTYHYGVDSELVRDSTGVYHIDIFPTQSGLWKYAFEGEDSVQITTQAAFYVSPLLAQPSTQFCTVQQVSAYLQTTLDPADDFALLCVEAATEMIQKYTNQTFVYTVDETTILDGSGSDIMLLPELPVVSVSECITDIDTGTPRTLLDKTHGANAEFDFTTDSGLLIRRRGQFVMWESRFAAVYGVWPDRRASVQVTYTHGYPIVPRDLQMITVVAAARGIAQDGADQEFTGHYRVRYASQPGTLTGGERRTLDRYRVRTK